MGAMWEQPSDSNTTLVKVKLDLEIYIYNGSYNSNTTLVKVKL